MSRKITSLMVLLAAVLLALPTQAQTAAKAKRIAFARNHVATSMQKGNLLTSAFVNTQKSYIVRADAAKQAAEARQFANAQEWANTPWYQWGEKAKELGYANRVKCAFEERRMESTRAALDPVAAKLRKAPAKAEQKDAHGIIIAPAEGETKFYTRAGNAYYASGSSLYTTTQSGHVEIVEAADGNVYIKDIISQNQGDTWVKGTKNGNTITIATGQPLAWSSNYSATISLFWGDYVEGSGFSKNTATEITFTINGDVISLDGSNEDHCIGLFWDDDNSFSGLGDYETVWTYDAEYTPASTDLVQLPEGATVEDWYNTATSVSSSGNTKYTSTAKVAFVGNDVYLSGIFKNYPESWIKGTLEGNTVTFSGLQFLGTYSSYNIFGVGASGFNGEAVLQDYQMTYDAESQTLTSVNKLLANAAEDRVYFLEGYEDITITKDAPVIEEEVAKTGDPVEVPYANSFDTSDETSALGVIDANADGKTWSFDKDNTENSNLVAKYTYDSNNDADDWLITPAVKLEAGKNYHFAIDAAARSATYNERLEVKMGTVAKASALTTEVIPSTDITWAASGGYQTLENEAITVEETGYYHFGIHAISDKDRYELYVDNLVIETAADKEAPAAVSDLTVTPGNGILEATLAFTAPAKNIGGEDLTANLEKIEIYRDGAVIATLENVAPGSAQTYVDNASDLTAGPHTYMVLAYNDHGKGQKSEEVTVTLTKTFDIPFLADFTKQAILVNFAVIDANGDNSTWKWSSQNGAYYGYDSNNDANDYLITSPIRMKAGQKYVVTISAKAMTDEYPERFEVLAGKAATVEALTETVIEPTVVTSDSFDDYTGTFSPAEDGIYVIAIHAISDANMYNFCVNTLSVEKELTPDAPAAPKLSVRPDATGETKANILIIAPSKNISGTALNKKLSKIVLLRDGEPIATFENVAPGAKLNYIDEDPNLTGGLHTYQAIPYDIAGDAATKSEKVTVFLGYDIPALVENFKGRDQVTSLAFTWDKVGEIGANGGFVNPTQVDYDIYPIILVDYYGLWTVPEHETDEPVVTVRDADAAAFDFDSEAVEQEYKYFSILPRWEGGESDETYTGVFIGKSYELPFVEHFQKSGFNYLTWIYNSSDNVEAYYGTEASDGDGTSFALEAANAEEFGEIIPGKVTLKGAANPKLVFDVKATAAATAKVFIEKMDGSLTEAFSQDITASDDFQTLKADLGSFAQEAYIIPHIYVDFNEAGAVMFDNVIIDDLLEYDLSAAIEAPKTVNAGEDAPVTVTIKNEGDNAISNYTVRIFANDEELLSQTVEEELASLKSKTFTAELKTTIFDDDADITLRAEVANELDLDEENNAAETLISVKESTVDGPTNVIAQEVADKGVIMYWTAPEVSEAGATTEVTEDFKSYDFGANETGKLGDWTVINNNGATKGGVFEDFPLANDGLPRAYEVLKPAEQGIENDQFNGPQGTLDEAYLISAYNLDEATESYIDNDDWLISPELPGVEQTITFSAGALSIQWGPSSYEVLASSTDKEIASFTKVAEETLSTAGWKQASVTLPEGTKYFAIRNVTDGDAAMLFMVGDITFLMGGGEAAGVAAYNIYVDGELFATVEGDKTTYTVAEGTVSPGDHEFAVSAVYTNGKESKPVIVPVTTTGIDEIIAGNKAVDVYTIDGKLVRSKTTDLSGLKGIFVVGGKAVILK